MDLLLSEYRNFDDYLKRAAPGLSSESFAHRCAARAKWAIKEVNHKVEKLKKAVLTPMMFITPLLTVEILKEVKDLKDLYSSIPNAREDVEAALRENTALIVNIDSSLTKLRNSISSPDWARQHAMSAVEKNVRSIASAVQSNSELIEQTRSSMEDTVSREASKLRQELNLIAVSNLNEVVESRLSLIQTQIDDLIVEKQQTSRKNGERHVNDSNEELNLLKTRVADSRRDLRTASQSGRESLQHLNTLLLKYNSKYDSKVIKWVSGMVGKTLGLQQISRETRELGQSTKVTSRALAQCLSGIFDTDTLKLRFRNPRPMIKNGPKESTQDLDSPEAPEIPQQLKCVPEVLISGPERPSAPIRPAPICPPPTRPAPRIPDQMMATCKEVSTATPNSDQRLPGKQYARSPPPVPKISLTSSRAIKSALQAREGLLD
ncbi:MAG: hypothetical protein Q9162_005833 [Coniocarpon cinnabarinum]